MSEQVVKPRFPGGKFVVGRNNGTLRLILVPEEKAREGEEVNYQGRLTPNETLFKVIKVYPDNVQRNLRTRFENNVLDTAQDLFDFNLV